MLQPGLRRIRRAPRLCAAFVAVVASLGLGAATLADGSRSAEAAGPPVEAVSTNEPMPTTTTTSTTAPPPTTTSTLPPPPPIVGPMRVMFLGDSVAWSTAAAIAPLGPTQDAVVLNAGIWGCGVVRGTPFRYFGARKDVIPNDCDHWPQQWQASIDRDLPHVAVVMVGRWELMDRVHQGRWTHIGDPVFDAYLGAELDQAIAVAGSRGARVVVATTPYYRRGDAPGGGTWPEDEPARVDLVNGLLRAAAARHPGVAVVEFGAIMSPTGGLTMEVEGLRLRTDGVHVANEAGPWISPRLLPAIRAAVGI